jgi:hypothetical protein
VAPGAPAAGECTEAAPCELEYAIEQEAEPHDEIILAPGTYEKSTTIRVTKTLDIHGTYGQPRPRVVSSATTTLYVLTLPDLGFVADGTTITHLELESTNGGANGLAMEVSEVSGMTLSRLVVIARVYRWSSAPFRR